LRPLINLEKTVFGEERISIKRSITYLHGILLEDPRIKVGWELLTLLLKIMPFFLSSLTNFIEGGTFNGSPSFGTDIIMELCPN
jgi:hypothetical protein